MSTAKRVLIVGPSWVGDMVMAQSLFKALRRHSPDMHIDVLAPAWSRPITERMPEVATSIDMPVGHGKVMLKARWRLARELAKSGYDQAIVLPNSLKSALVPAFAGIAVRTGWRGEWRYGLLNDIRTLDKEQFPLMVDRFVALGAPSSAPSQLAAPWPSLSSDQSRLPSLLHRYNLRTDSPVLALCPGAEFGPAKRWPAIHYAALAQAQIEAGWQVWVFGSAKDAPVAQDIVAHLPESSRAQVYSLAGETTLADAIDLLAASDAVVSNDSGLMHIAAALGRPLVAVYGSTSTAFTPPLGDKVKTVSLSLSCQPCFARQCPLTHQKCLVDLAPAQVIDAVRSLVSI
ncbi:lipopolysaccharide heptosyltransferase II [Gilvimarinus sp. SDUM040013]|uniref:lipopolysaccharide heptosyltransferase II n=1 Tax=Gilvimarinus gilvus TaxID=3058038 RepID=A0ABU4S0D2_9GAMM|nr:lipopolysaccharide heptosyltransferase II [Gilvimarinus sp. SDUM040013]MDO3387404.1 lipopolysaccharide heptosyltransferase II [Gilvimarinus sp. SDUM040013]MDX6849881.1 lipopolysaccharide heptosyltransferase II [Gilvimarinus sp. SDUM040013]